MPYFCNNAVNLLVIHIPKTGGTSLEQYFSKKYDISLNNTSLWWFLDTKTKHEFGLEINSSLQHMTYQTIMKHKEFFKINECGLEILSIVRNPYERVISDLFFWKKITKSTSAQDTFSIIQHYIRNDIDNHSIPQYLFVTDENCVLLPNITILNTETLRNDMIRIGYVDFDLKCFANLENDVDYYSYLNNDSIQLINEFYDYDFKLFNYEKLCVI
jgi:hypothetical protein